MRSSRPPRDRRESALVDQLVRPPGGTPSAAVVRQGLGELLRDVDAQLGHGLDHSSVYLTRRGTAGRADMDAVLGMLSEGRDSY